MNINIARLDLVSMRLAVLCAESGSLSAAAKRAHCSISAGSQRLSALESTLGRHLFVRDHRGLQLTEAGVLFVRHARVILDQLQALGEQVACLDSAGESCRTRKSAEQEGLCLP
jgi:DNA-binding transcriptional LysR family regulator